MLTEADRGRMEADLREIRNDRPAVIAIRRGNTTLAAQTVRIARGGNIQAAASDTDAVQAAVGAVIVVGDKALNIQPGDRFTVGAALYEVTALHPNRDQAVQAQAKMVH